MLSNLIPLISIYIRTIKFSIMRLSSMPESHNRACYRLTTFQLGGEASLTIILHRVIIPKAMQITLSIESPEQRRPGGRCRPSRASMGSSQSRTTSSSNRNSSNNNSSNNNSSNWSHLPRSHLPHKSISTINEPPLPWLEPPASGMVCRIL